MNHKPHHVPNRLVFFLLVTSTFFFSCSKNAESDLFSLSLDKTSLRLDTVAGSSGTVTLQAADSWTAEIASDAASWLRLDKVSG